MKQNVLAIDLGASGGRALVGSYDGSSITLKEIHRFANEPVRLGGTFYWDVLRLLHEIKQSLLLAQPYQIAAIGIDTWGVDFGLLDAQGRLLSNPVHYRDSRTKGLCQKAAERIPQEALYAATGNQIMEINTAFQLMALREQDPYQLERAKTLLLMPDLFAYFLTGEIAAERSIASTTQLYHPQKGDWAHQTAEQLGIPGRLLPPIQDSGSLRGMLSQEICTELGIPRVPVYAVCGHDTQSAMLAVPADSPEFTFLSCGTWSLLGKEHTVPVLTNQAMELAFTNETGYGGKTALLKNLTGLWLIQESKRQYAREGIRLSFDEIVAAAEAAAPGRSLIDTEDPRFAADGDLPERIRTYCRETAQPVPETQGEVFRCICESLALQYRTALEQLYQLTGTSAAMLYVIGGGIRNRLLMQKAADFCGLMLRTCGTEATALGNAAVLFGALGELHGLDEMRQVCGRSQPIQDFTADSASSVQTDEIIARYQKIRKIKRG